MVKIDLQKVLWIKRSQYLDIHLKYRKGKPGVNFINVLRATFTRPDPKSAKKTVKLSVFLWLSESGCVKAAHRTLMKLTPAIKPTERFYALMRVGLAISKLIQLLKKEKIYI